MTCAIVTAVIGSLLWFRHHLWGITFEANSAHLAGLLFWLAAALCVAILALAPAGLRPIYVGLTILTLPIGYVLSYVLLAVLWYLIITPVAVVSRLVRRGPIHLKFDRQAPTYWAPRKDADDIEQYFRQF